ncbi:hypothetical protein ACFXPT_29190 [Streptomyces goshikiensis]|uniref:hypothetical protein n=1 Tax=Streptomyces goshikiensis TaxID=1942 RepID=UPI0036C42FB2
MGNGSHQESGLSKSVWSDADFEAMGWHDATVHGLSVQPTNDILPRFLLDLDYIVRWVHPVPPATHFSFWISPATLVFEGVFDLQGDLDFQGLAVDLEIDGVHRLVPDDAPPRLLARAALAHRRPRVRCEVPRLRLPSVLPASPETRIPTGIAL